MRFFTAPRRATNRAEGRRRRAREFEGRTAARRGRSVAYSPAVALLASTCRALCTYHARDAVRALRLLHPGGAGTPGIHSQSMQQPDDKDGGAGDVSLGAHEYLRNRLTPEEAAQFAEQGWLLIEAALPSEQRWLLEELVRAMHGPAKLAAGRLPHETIVQAAFSPANSLQDHEATMHLLKNERVLPKVVDILGANIKCYHSHWNYTPGRQDVAEPDYSGLPTLGFHQDSHRVNVEMGHEQPGGPRPRLSLKCAYFLSDCSSSGRANTWIVPGSHLLDTLPSVPGGRGQPAGAVPVLAPANSCLIFVSRPPFFFSAAFALHSCVCNDVRIGRRLLRDRRTVDCGTRGPQTSRRIRGWRALLATLHAG